MRLAPGFTRESLAALGEEAVGLLCRGEIAALADRYGYAFAGKARPEIAIREDLARSLTEVGGTALGQAPQCSVRAVKYFEPNSSKLIGVVECLVPTNNGSSLLVELIVAGDAGEHYLTLEEISAGE